MRVPYLLLALFCSISAAAAPKPAKVDPRREFVSACVQAFNQSTGNEAREVGVTICECTSKESKHQGATLESLKAETQKIKADPKYKISDPKLLAAFQYCTIETLREE
jgi:hypothetical protein